MSRGLSCRSASACRPRQNLVQFGLEMRHARIQQEAVGPRNLPGDGDLPDNAGGPICPALSSPEHKHAIAEAHGLANIVGNEQDAPAVRAPDLQQPALQLIAGNRVERLPNGSSSSSTGLPCTTVRRKDTRCRIPPESWRG